MRIPSFIKLPRNRQYYIKPRYYDPIKEDMQERTERIRKELRGETSSNPSRRITFERKTAPLPSSSLLQTLIIVVLTGLVAGWLYIGNDAMYFLLIAFPVYFVWRLKTLIRRK